MTKLVFSDTGARLVTSDGASAQFAADAEAAAQEAVDAVEGAGIVANPALNNHFIFGAGNANVTGSNNVGVGPDAGQYLTTGSRNVFNGHLAGRDIFGGADNVVNGWAAMYLAQGANYNVVVGSAALASASGAVHSNVVIGAYAANLYQGNEIVAVGRNALVNATGAGNIAVGHNAGGATTTGARNLFLGFNAHAPATADDTIVIGYNVAATKSNEITIGTGVQTHLRMFGIPFAHWDADAYNLWLGNDGPDVDPTGLFNLALGRDALNNVTTANACIAIGSGALELHQSGNNTLAIGVTAGQFSINVWDSVLLGGGAARYATTGVGGTVTGYRALQHAASVGNNTVMGDSAFWHTQGSANVGGGYVVAEGMSEGDSNVVFGRGAMRYRDDGDENVFLGELSGAIIANSLPGQPGANIGIGDAAPSDNIGGAPAGHRNIGVGIKSLGDALGNLNTACGFQSGLSIKGTVKADQKNAFFGANSGHHPNQKVDVVNSIAIGADTYTTEDNQAVIGNSSITQTVLRGVTRHTTYTVATLPSASAMGAGARAFVTNSNSTTFNAVVAGGGGNAVPVFSDGANWRVG